MTRLFRAQAIFLLAMLALTSGVSGQEHSDASATQTPAIRVWGYDGQGPVLGRWESAYTKLHPEIRFENHLNAPATVMAGLYDGVADLVLMGREIWPVETMAYHWVYQEQPFGITVLTAGLNAPGQSFTPVVIVNAANPLKSISEAQLDAIYGSEHRRAPANIRTWGDLGLQGAWASHPIDVYGFGPEDSVGVFFRHDVLRLDFKPNPSSHLLSDGERASATAAKRIDQAVARDPYAIGYTKLSTDRAVKVLAVGVDSGVYPTDSTVADHSYALARSFSIYVRRFPDRPVDPRVDGFVRFVLTPDAQALVRPEEGFLPLNPLLVAKQIEKLDAPLPRAASSEWKEQ